MRRTSGCRQYRRRDWQQRGRPGPHRARRLARARGSVYRPRHGKPCPPLLPPRRPLAKREQRREHSFTWPLSRKSPSVEEFAVVRLSRSRSRSRAREISLACASGDHRYSPRRRRRSCRGGSSARVLGSPAMWLESGTLRALRGGSQGGGFARLGGSRGSRLDRSLTLRHGRLAALVCVRRGQK